jgi:hypothetical protein
MFGMLGECVMSEVELDADRQSSWDFAAMQLQVDAEGLADPIAAFASTTFPSMLRTKHNQIVYGRRGSGKTHLFRCLDSEPTKPDTHTNITVYVNGKNIYDRANVAVGNPGATALGLYVELLRILADKLYKQVIEGLHPTWWDRWPVRERGKVARRARQVAQTLNILLQKGQVRILPAGDASVESKTVDEVVNKAGGTVGASFNVADLRHSGVKLEGQLETKRQRSLKDTTVRQLPGHTVLPFTEVAKQIRALLVLLQPPDGSTTRLVMLFDEWSDIPLLAQPLLAEMLKRTLKAIGEACVKIGCIPGRTRLVSPVSTSEPVPIGFEPGEDIMPDVDLDMTGYLVIEPRHLLTFFLALLQKHMAISLDWVRSMSLDEFGKYVLSEIFEKPTVFTELCVAAGCVPRDFLSLVRMSTSRRREGHHNKIQVDDVQAAARRLYKGKRDSFSGNLAPELKLLDTIYRQVVAPNRSHFFLISESMVDNPRIVLLYAHKLIHRIPIEFYDEERHQSFAYFQIDYGILLNLIDRDRQRSPSWTKEQGITVALAGGQSVQSSLTFFLLDWINIAQPKDSRSAWQRIIGIPQYRPVFPFAQTKPYGVGEVTSFVTVTPQLPISPDVDSTATEAAWTYWLLDFGQAVSSGWAREGGRLDVSPQQLIVEDSIIEST